MKRLLLLLLFITGFLNAQIVNIPDINFKSKLISIGVDTNSDGEIQISEALVPTTLNLYNSNISELTGIEAFINLIELDCSYNTLTNVNISQCISLTDFSCNNNAITSLELNQNTELIYLRCQQNQLTNLDLSQNVHLNGVECSLNNLTYLNVSQCVDLSWLYCQVNELTDIDLSNNISLSTFYGQLNQFTTVNLNQNTNIASARLSDNPLLTTVFFKNGITSNTLPRVENNVNLSYVCIDEDRVMLMQSYIDFLELDVEINSYCSFTPGESFNTISGLVTFDSSNDGCEASDTINTDIRIDINDGAIQGSSFINNSGNYTFYTQDGNFTLTPYIENPTWFNFSPTTASVSFANNNNNSVIQDFCITAVGMYSDLEIIILPVVFAQPGFDAEYQLIYRNKGNQSLSGNIDFTFDDNVLDFVSTSILTNTEATGNFTWNYTDLLPFETRTINVVFNVNSPMETSPINIGDILNFTVGINPVSGDETPSDNVYDYNEIVVGSFDPNDKICMEGDIIEPTMIGEYLHYNINFENTGTAAATFVVIKDEIDHTKFDMDTFQIMYGSHPMETRIAGSKVEFIFDNINLGPDEKGNVVFKIKTKNSLIIGDSVTNKAEIFFDYNFPIVTNDAITTFQTLSINEFELDDSIGVFPNPSNDIITIKSNTNISSLEIYDLQGRIVSTRVVDENSSTIDISSLKSGVYFFKIKTELGAKVEKVIKQ